MTNVSKLRLYHRCLRWLLTVDGAVLFFLGAFLIAAPRPLEAIFRFKGLPDAVSYIVGLWGCGLVTIGLGYLGAAGNPRRHIIWVQVGFARNVLETILGVVYLARGFVTVGQAGAGILLAGLLSLAYFVFYPRPGPPMKLDFENPSSLTTPPPPQKP